MLEWITIITVVLIVGILLDGWRRMRNKQQGKIKMSLSMHQGTEKEDLLAYGPELPNGGARVISKDAEESGFEPEPELDFQESVPMLMDVQSSEDVPSATHASSISQDNSHSVDENRQASDTFFDQAMYDPEPVSSLEQTLADAKEILDDTPEAVSEVGIDHLDQSIDPELYVDEAAQHPAVSDEKFISEASVNEPTSEETLSEPSEGFHGVASNLEKTESKSVTMDADEILGLKPLPVSSFDEVFTKPEKAPETLTKKPSKSRSLSEHAVEHNGRKEPGFGEPQDLFAETFSEEGDIAGVVDHSERQASGSGFDLGKAVKSAVSQTVAGVSKTTKSVSHRSFGGKASAPNESAQQAPVNPEDVIVINVMASKGTRFNGSDLLEAMIACGLRFGDMDIFHRHETFEGEGEILFSLANMVKPGSFDLTQIDYMTTPGVSLFMTMSSVQDPMKAFNTLAASAHHLGKQLSGELKDENRSVMTNQTLEHNRQRISEFQRKRHLQRASA